MKKRIIILGGGFAGLTLARKLQRSAYDILLIDRYNFHQFQPLFYQVATARLDASNISFPLRKVFEDAPNVNLRVAEVKYIDAAQREVHTDAGNYAYDYLVLATGADTNYYGNGNIAAHAFPMKSTAEALYLRMKVLQNFENRYTAADADAEQGLLHYVIVGGGPTGVELAGALAEMKKYVLPKDYHDLDFSQMHIYLVEASGRLLSAMSEKSSARAKRYLENMGVEVRLGEGVNDYDGHTVTLSSGAAIRSDTLIWAAGIRGNLLPGLDRIAPARGNRVPVNEQMQVIGYEQIYAIGDVAYMETSGFPKGHPQLANVAISQAAALAANFRALLRNRPTRPFRYSNNAAMATVGRSKAVIDLPGLHLGGFFAWFAWMALHLLFLMGMKNRLMVFIHWVSAYFSKNSSLRLIFKGFSRP